MLVAALELATAARSLRINPHAARGVKKVGQHCSTASSMLQKYSRLRNKETKSEVNTASELNSEVTMS